MQHTEKYQLNLIEKTDLFSPDALNENAQRVEAALSAQQEALQTAAGGLDQRLRVFEAKRFVLGTYNASNNGAFVIDLGFTPIAVLVHQTTGGLKGVTALAVTGQGNQGGLEIVENGFQSNVAYGVSALTGVYTYIAFG